MGRIPIIEHPAGGEGSTPFTPYGPTQVATGADELARSMSEATARFSHEIETANNQARALRVTDLTNQYIRDARQTLHGDGGYFGKMGFDAINTADAHSSLDKLKDKYAEQLPDDRAKAMFMGEAGAHSLVMHTEIERHATQQRLAYMKQVHDDTVDRTIWEGQRYTLMPDKVQQIVGDSLPTIIATKQALGINSPQQVTETVGHIYQQILQQFVADGRATLGQKLLDAPTPLQVGGKAVTVREALGPLGDRIEGAIAAAAAEEIGVSKGAAVLAKAGGSYKRADALIAQGLVDVASGKTDGLFQNLKEAEVARNYIRTDQTIRNNIREQTTATVISNGIHWFEQNLQNGDLPSWDSFVAIAPPGLKAQLRDSEGWTRLQKWRETATTDAPTLEQTKAFLGAIYFKNTMDEKFAALNPGAILQWRDKLHPTQWNALVHMWDAATSQNGPVLRSLKMAESGVNNALMNDGLIPSRSVPGGPQVGKPETYTPEQRRAWETGILLINEEVKNFRETHEGKAPDIREIQQMVATIRTKVKVPKKLFGIIPYTGTVSAVEAISTNAPLLAVAPPEVGSPEYNQVLAIFKQANPDRAPTAEAVLSFWYSKLADKYRATGSFDFANAIEKTRADIEEGK